ncbi:hypothetical protein VTI28DRAFT_2271 [Corynascus sepedonium]
MTQGRDVFSVESQAYRGPVGGPSTIKPDLLVIKLLRAVNPASAPGNPQSQFPQASQISSRDILWVECKPPCDDTPSGWKDVISEAADRLRSAHPNRVVFLIVAVGLKWMFFKWDPTNPLPLRVQGHNQAVRWQIPHSQLCYDQSIAGQRHVAWNNATSTYDTVLPRLAYTLDFWSPGQNNQPQHGHDLHLLVRCFQHVQDSQLQGANPSHFS